MKTFRYDINALRAVAVIAVVFFHFYPNQLPGGFIGVDVFFVISGFLMTGIIFRGIENCSFSLIQFYIARVNRIIPALSVLCMALLFMGWFLLTPIDYKALGNHVYASLGFFSNIVYWQESGYFEAASHEKWLLHTWSLSVEWQFYILYPLALVFLKKFISLEIIKKVILCGAILGFIFSVQATLKWPEPAYYLLPTRAFEMLIGGVAYLYPFKFLQNSHYKWLGLVIIVLSCFLISSDDLWPGYLAFFPVFGSFLFIQANDNECKISNNILIQKLGNWSYSIYLWHWPFVVAITYFSLNFYFSFVFILLSIFMGWLSFTVIEQAEFKRKLTSLSDILKYKPLYLTILPCALSFVVYTNSGLVSRFDSIANISQLSENRAAAEKYYRNTLISGFSNQGESIEKSDLCALDGGKHSIHSLEKCLTAKLGESGFLIIGDSHGRDFLHAIQRAYPNEKFSMLYESGCVPTTYGRCFKLLEQVRKKFILNNTKIKGIIFASLYKEKFATEQFINELNEQKYGLIPIAVIGLGVRLDKSVIETAIKAKSVTDTYNLKGTINDSVPDVNYLLSKIPNTKFFDKYAVFCQKDVCQINQNLEPYIWDSDHLTSLGINKFSEKLKESNFLPL
ncbi:acyltransferase family protein [Pseudoalteromonas gelatinilytica]